MSGPIRIDSLVQGQAAIVFGQGFPWEPQQQIPGHNLAIFIYAAGFQRYDGGNHRMPKKK